MATTGATEEPRLMRHKSRCFVCLKTAAQSPKGKLSRCGTCMQRSYCSKDCQTVDWKAHKAECLEYSARQKALAAEHNETWEPGKYKRSQVRSFVPVKSDPFVYLALSCISFAEAQAQGENVLVLLEKTTPGVCKVRVIPASRFKAEFGCKHGKKCCAIDRDMHDLSSRVDPRLMLHMAMIQGGSEEKTGVCHQTRTALFCNSPEMQTLIRSGGFEAQAEAYAFLNDCCLQANHIADSGGDQQSIYAWLYEKWLVDKRDANGAYRISMKVLKRVLCK